MTIFFILEILNNSMEEDCRCAVYQLCVIVRFRKVVCAEVAISVEKSCEIFVTEN